MNDYKLSGLITFIWFAEMAVGFEIKLVCIKIENHVKTEEAVVAENTVCALLAGTDVSLREGGGNLLEDK